MVSNDAVGCQAIYACFAVQALLASPRFYTYLRGNTMKLFKWSLILVLITGLFSTSAFADNPAPKLHKRISVKSGSYVEKGSHLTLDFSHLSPYYYWQVSCTLYSDDSHLPVSAFMGSLMYSKVFLNSYMMDMFGDYLSWGYNSLLITNVNANNGYMHVYNDDDSWFFPGRFKLSGDCDAFTL